MNDLDGLTILRYGHVYDSGGGIEQYLVDLNRTLSARSSVRTIQVQLTSVPARVGEVEEGPVRRVSLFVEQTAHEQAIKGTGDDHGFIYEVKTWLREKILFTPLIYRCFTGPLLALRPIPSRPGEPDGTGETVRALHRRQPLNLVCLHSVGGADTEEVIAVAKAEGIPIAYVHHFSNDRLSSFANRRQLDRLDGVSGVCGVDVPSFLRDRFQNVSDGIDTDFFRLDEATRAERRRHKPVIFLPARITPAKGQAALIRAAGELKRRGLDFRVILAGRTDSQAYLDEMKALIAQEGLTEHVEFVGQLNAAGLRQWYGVASLVAFPTTHHEGLPRILLECQAMEVVPVVHTIGGTAEGVREGETGFLIGVGDSAALVDRLTQLLKNEELRAKMGRAGRKLAEDRFSLAALATRHEQFYLKALAAAGRPPR